MSLSFLLTVLAIQGLNLTITVNDPLSHGVVGDSLLSLDEAIRLANGTLLPAALSAAEQARITGTGTIFEHIVIEAMTTPIITLQNPLTNVVGLNMHVKIHGVELAGVLPVIQGGSHARVFTVRTHLCHLEDLHIVGGQVAIDLKLDPSTSPTTHMALVADCDLEGQTIAGVRLHGTGLDESMLMMRNSSLRNMPLGFLLDDQTAGGMVMLEGERLEMDGVVLGGRVLEAGAGGNMSMFQLFRSTFTNGTTLAEHRRLPGSAQQFMFRIVHTAATCSGTVLEVEGSATGLTMIHHHHSNFVAGAGQKALWVYPRTAEFDVHGSEMMFEGDVSIAANLASIRIWQQNCWYRNGTVTYDVDGALPNLLWNHYENCTINVPATARSPVVVRNSELLTTNVHGASFLAPVTLQTCWHSGGTVTGFAAAQQAAPAPFLGTTVVSPAAPQVGTSVQLAANLPLGIGLVWDFALSYARPTTTTEPVRFYGDPATVVVLPGLVVFQSLTTVPIPNAPSLAGLEFYVQGISLPLIGQSYVPAFHLPRGQLIWLQP